MKGVAIACPDYQISKGAVEWYYTTGEEEITKDSKKITAITTDSVSTVISADDENHPEAYDMKLRVKGYVVASDEWTEESTITIKSRTQ